MLTAQNIPQGYSVTQSFNGKWQWESILAPECHSGSGYDSYEAAIAACRKANGL